ncbi:MAG: dihydropteroate synthase [Acidobacteriota bacterium]|nr:MAG: dihydropteroate synthase [Acidobacteriota bacterium]
MTEGKPAERILRTSRRTLDLGAGPLLMAIINVTPDSFSDGGEYLELDSAIAAAEKALEEGADILDIGGESTRPGSSRVPEDEELARVIPLVEDLAKRFDAAISVDTSKRAVAERALEAGAEIINDISGLRFDPALAEAVAGSGAGIVLMHSRGTFEEIHLLEPVEDIRSEVVGGLEESIGIALAAGIDRQRICLDVGIGFGKSFEQNLELIKGLSEITEQLEGLPMLIGVSRKSFVGRILGDAPVSKRLHGTLAANAVALMNGADILRVHDVKAHRDLIDVVNAIGVSQ